jgi:hypothetical protein
VLKSAWLELLADTRLRTVDCAGISMAFPSLMEPGTGRILGDFGKYADAPGLDLRHWAWTELNLPLAIENDARMALMGERLAGAGPGWREERTGLHEREFIETRRCWFTQPVTHHTRGGVNVLNLVQREAAVVESPDGSFDPFPVHYAETFIVPAAVGSYRIRPAVAHLASELATIKAGVRTSWHCPDNP